MKWRHIKAVFNKQFADTAHNRSILIQFLAFPVMMALLLLAMTNSMATEATRASIVMLMSTVFTGLMPILTVYNIINEDKMYNTLRVLIMSTVKPLEYLLGITSYILFVSLIIAFIFGLLGGLRGVRLLAYVGVLLLGTAVTLVFGSAMAMYSARRRSAGGLITIVAMLNSMIPLLSMFSEPAQKFSKYLYTYQVNNMLGDIYGNYFDWGRLIIVFANFIIFFVLFMLAYKDNRFYE